MPLPSPRVTVIFLHSFLRAEISVVLLHIAIEYLQHLSFQRTACNLPFLGVNVGVVLFLSFPTMVTGKFLNAEESGISKTERY